METVTGKRNAAKGWNLFQLSRTEYKKLYKSLPMIRDMVMRHEPLVITSKENNTKMISTVSPVKQPSSRTVQQAITHFMMVASDSGTP